MKAGTELARLERQCLRYYIILDLNFYFLFYYILLKILYLLLKRNIDLVDLLVCNESVI